MRDLIERLRNFEGSDELGNGDFSLLREAADALEALREEVAEWKRVAAAQAELHDEAEARAERLAEALRGLEEREQRDEALLRQVLEVLEYYRSGEDYQPTPASEAITTIKERLK